MSIEILSELNKSTITEYLHELQLEEAQAPKRSNRHDRPLEEVQVSMRRFKVLQGREGADTVNAIVAACTATGAVAAINVAYDEGSNKGCRNAVEQILKPKRKLGLRNGLEERWNVSGIPESIIFDDSVRCGGGIEGFFSDIGCSAYFSFGCPHRTAKVERLFRLFEMAVGMPRKPSLYRFKDDDEVRHLLHEFVIEFYHNQPFYASERDGLKAETPMEAWTRAVQEFGIRQPAEMR